jgi:hypothetical protein
MLRLVGRRLPHPALALALVVRLDRARRMQQLLELAAVRPHAPALRADVDLHLVAPDLLHAFVAVRAHQQRQRLLPGVGLESTASETAAAPKARATAHRFNRGTDLPPGIRDLLRRSSPLLQTVSSTWARGNDEIRDGAPHADEPAGAL